MSRIDILIERAKRRAAQESGPNTSQGASTSGDQVEYLVRSGVLSRCAMCSNAVEPSTTHQIYGNVVCEGCYDTIQQPRGFQDTAPGYAP